MIEEKKDKYGVSYTSDSKATHVGKRGDHPLGGAVGAAVGAAVGGAVAGAVEGAALGTAAGVPGMAAGLAIGGVIGALAGKGAAQAINPTTEDEYWEENYKNRDYIASGENYDTYRPAYRHGVDSYTKYEGRRFEDVEPKIQSEWKARPDGALPWDKARPASRDAYERLYNNRRDFREDDVDTETGR